MASSEERKEEELMEAMESKMEEWCVCVQWRDRSHWTDQWKLLFGAYRWTRSPGDGCEVAGNGPLLLLLEQTEMMNSDVFTCQQPVVTSSGSGASHGACSPNPPKMRDFNQLPQRPWDRLKFKYMYFFCSLIKNSQCMQCDCFENMIFFSQFLCCHFNITQWG